jgi:hypothetical protein
LSKGLATGQFTTKADTSKMLSHAEQQLNAFRDSLAENNKKGRPIGNRQTIFNEVLRQHNLVDTSGAIKIKDPTHLTKAMLDLGNINQRKDSSGARISKTIDTDTLFKNLMGTGGATSGPGVLQSFSNPELAARRLSSASKGSALSAAEAADFINKGYPNKMKLPPLQKNITPLRSANSQTYYDGKGVLKAIRPSFRGSAGAAALGLASNFGLPYLNENAEARTENTRSFVDNLRRNLATAKSPEIGGNREKILGSLDDLRNNMGDELTSTELRNLFDKLEEIVPQRSQK